MQTLIFALASACAFGFAACDRPVPKPVHRQSDAAQTKQEPSSGRIRHARVFSLEFAGDTTRILVRRPWQGAERDFAYLLVPASHSDSSPRKGSARGDTLVVPVPVRRAVTLTTTNLRHLESLGALDALAGLGGGRYVCSPEVRARLADGRIRDVGADVNLDIETLVSLRPDLLITYVVGRSSDGALGKLAETGIPAVIEGSYMEETPLGRAEWIKFTAAFLGQGRAADSVFALIESEYQRLSALAKQASRRPTVVVGAPFGGVWWVPGGRTYVARLLADAGADYLWAADTTYGSLNLDLETVLAKAGGAEVWLNGGEWRDLAAARSQDPRYALFRAWREGRIWNNDGGRCASGGRDIFESGALRPDWVLADLIALLHPELLPGHAMRWYRKLPGAGE